MTDAIQEPIDADEAPDEAPPEAPAEPTPEEQEAEEQEEPSEPPEAPEEPPPPSQPAGVVSERELEKMFKRVETANANYSKQLGNIMGDEATVLEACPRCADPFLGFIFPALMKPADPDTKAAVLLSVGEEPPQVSEADAYSRRCDACKGWGRVLSGSKLNAEKTLRCIPCGGRGWVAVGDERRVPQQAVAAPVTPNGAESPVEQPPDTDPWGRGPNDPDYGRMPQFVGKR